MRLFEGTPFDIPPTCDRCGELESVCRCPALPQPAPRVPAEKQTARVHVEKRKKGKFVTVVRGLGQHDFLELLTRLKNHCGAGGSIKNDSIEIQGKHLERIRDFLGKCGYRLK